MNELTFRITNKYTLLLGCLVYFFLLFFIDIRFLTLNYGYNGYVHNFSVGKLLLSVFSLCSLFSFLGRNNANYAIKFYYYLIIVIVFIPALVHFSVTADYYYFYINCSSCLTVFIVAGIIRLPTFTLMQFRQLDLLRVLSVVVALFLTSIILMGGWRYFNLDLSKVYDYRKEAANNLPSSFVYLSSIISKICLPMLVVLALHNKKYLFGVFALVSAVLLFGLTAHKGTLFNPFAAAFIFLFLGKRDVVKYIVLALISICLLSFVDFYLYELQYGGVSGWFGSLFARRVLMTPALLNDLYIQFFGVSDLYYWCHSKISLGLSTCTFDVTPSLLIGKHYFGVDTMSANTGFIGAGFSNMRFLGVFVYSVLLAIILKVLIAFARKIGTRIVLSTSFLIIFNILTSTDIFTAFFSHGLIFLFFIYLILPRDFNTDVDG